MPFIFQHCKGTKNNTHTKHLLHFFYSNMDVLFIALNSCGDAFFTIIADRHGKST